MSFDVRTVYSFEDAMDNIISIMDDFHGNCKEDICLKVVNRRLNNDEKQKLWSEKQINDLKVEGVIKEYVFLDLINDNVQKRKDFRKTKVSNFKRRDSWEKLFDNLIFSEGDTIIIRLPGLCSYEPGQFIIIET